MRNALIGSLFSPAGMEAGRTAVVNKFEWFTHASCIGNFESIQRFGIKPSRPGDNGATFKGQDEIEAFLGRAGLDVVCLSPYPKSILLSLNKGDDMFKVALNRDSLPERVGIDCSYGGTYCCAERMHADMPNMAYTDIFLAMVQKTEVIVTFDAIPPDVLRVCPKVTPNAPIVKWPMLVQVDKGDVEIFYRDRIGNVLI
jgi:hypothetical protein